ncbi:MAG: prepilin-type N-terminal cleavage/methylation domain-containing protein [Bacilli bacterium]
MKKKGFTLIELLAVIIVIGIIAIIAIPAISKLINKSERNTLKIQENLFLETGVNYFLDNIGSNQLTLNQYEVQSVSLGTLVDLGYIKPIKDPNTGLSCNVNSRVEAVYAGNRKYEYAVYFSCGDYETVKNGSHFKMVDFRFLKGVKDYISDNPGVLPSGIGNKTTITYNTLKTGEYISNINDVSSDEECSTKSKVVIKKTGNNTYEYLSGLICTSYLRIEAWDLLEGKGYFKSDSNGDGLGDGWESDWGGENFEINTIDGVQSFDATEQWGQYGSSVTITPNHIFYLSGKIKSDSSATLTAGNTGYWDFGVDYYNSGVFDRISKLGVIPVGPNIKVIVEENEELELDTIEAKEIFFVDVTDMFGTSNEPSLSQMDFMLENSGY